MNVIFTSAEDAEEAFYDAIGRGDIEALMIVWADEDENVCIHPTGQRLTGPLSFRECWHSIFENYPRLTVRVTHSLRWKGAMLDVHSVVETLYLGDESAPHGPMLSTNVFQRGPTGWRLLAHHTSAAADASVADATSDSHKNAQHTLH